MKILSKSLVMFFSVLALSGCTTCSKCSCPECPTPAPVAPVVVKKAVPVVAQAPVAPAEEKIPAAVLK
jgi:hypothetical protein